MRLVIGGWVVCAYPPILAQLRGASKRVSSVKRTSMAICPACQHVNVDDALMCVACGSPLVTRCPECKTINARTRIRCHHCAARLETHPPVDDGPDVDQPPPPAVPVLTEEEVTAPILFRALPEIALPAAQPTRARRTVAAGELPLPAISPDAFEPLPVLASETAPAPAAMPATSPFAERKAEMRAAVRRARQRQFVRQAATVATSTGVLLLDPDPVSRERVAIMLTQFGFDVQVASSLAEADRLVGQEHFVAAFVGLGEHAGRAASLCARLRSLPEAVERPMSVLAMVEPGRHADRVRMELAGVDAVLMRPIERGPVAQALESSGVQLPHDPRAARRAGATS